MRASQISKTPQWRDEQARASDSIQMDKYVQALKILVNTERTTS